MSEIYKAFNAATCVDEALPPGAMVMTNGWKQSIGWFEGDTDTSYEATTYDEVAALMWIAYGEKQESAGKQQ